jgi:hypothetical protein
MMRWTRVRIFHVRITATIHSIRLTQVSSSKEHINNLSIRCKRRIGILQRERCFLSWTIHWVSLLILQGRFIMKHMRHPVDKVLHWVYGIERIEDSFVWISVALSRFSPNKHLKCYFKSQFRNVFVQFAYFLITLANSLLSACFPPLKRNVTSWCHYAMCVCVCCFFLFQI